MPTINTYYSSEAEKQALLTIVAKLKTYTAELLTCGDIALKSSEVSVRLIQADMTGSIGVVEMEICAHAFTDRVKQQDDICLKIKSYVESLLPDLGDVRVWLVLAELGHSWE